MIKFQYIDNLTEISVAFIQQENGTPHRSTLGLEQLKYSFFPQSKYPSWLKPQHLNCKKFQYQQFYYLYKKKIYKNYFTKLFKTN